MRCRAGWVVITQPALYSRKPSQLGPGLAWPGIALLRSERGPGGNTYLLYLAAAARVCIPIDDTQAHPAALRRKRSSKPRPVWGPREGAATRNEIGTRHYRKVQRGPPLPVRLPSIDAPLQALPAPPKGSRPLCSLVSLRADCISPPPRLRPNHHAIGGIPGPGLSCDWTLCPPGHLWVLCLQLRPGLRRSCGS